jgi:hypothetical protein
MALLPLYEEAEDCRRKALSYPGQPEAPFLLHLARKFERLASERPLKPLVPNENEEGLGRRVG